MIKHKNPPWLDIAIMDNHDKPWKTIHNPEDQPLINDNDNDYQAVIFTMTGHQYQYHHEPLIKIRIEK